MGRIYNFFNIEPNLQSIQMINLYFRDHNNSSVEKFIITLLLNISLQKYDTYAKALAIRDQFAHLFGPIVHYFLE